MPFTNEGLLQLDGDQHKEQIGEEHPCDKSEIPKCDTDLERTLELGVLGPEDARCCYDRQEAGTLLMGGKVLSEFQKEEQQAKEEKHGKHDDLHIIESE